MDKLNPRKISPQGLHQWMQENADQPLLVDVREKEELLLAPFPFPVIHLPLSEISEWNQNLLKLIPLDKSVVAICHAGIRSLNFGIWLLEQNSDYQIWNLEGGIDSWSNEIDSSVPRY